MSRQFLAIPCEGATLAATLDLPAGPLPTTALLIVSGGNELRSGAWAGQARLAARMAKAGHAVLRFDRRGVGDSDGPNGGYRSSAPDIAAALAALRAAVPGLEYIAAWGNCDGASALMLAQGAGCDALILSNPWTFEEDGDSTDEPAAEMPATPMPAQALRAHYLARLANPAAIKRLLSGQIPIKALAASLLGMMRPAAPPSTLATDMAQGIASFTGPIALLIADKDRTAQAFLGGWNKRDPRLHICPGASHSFVEPASQEWLAERVLDVLQEVKVKV